MKERPSTGISGANELRAAYEDHAVAAGYVENRFREPLGAVLHEAQLRVLFRAIRAAAPRRILEVAPGPARLTVDVVSAFSGTVVLVDASAAMLAEARRRLPGDAAGRVAYVRGDAFALPVRGLFDLAYSFRFVRHFDTPGRARLYQAVTGVLRPGGLFVFDAVNRAVAEPLRTAAPAGQFPIFDALLDEDTLHEELADAGFDRVTLTGVQRRHGLLYRIQVLVSPRSRRLALAAMRALERLPGGRPLEWVVSCRKR